MAAIKGISLKGITKFKGHEGEPCSQGNIHLNGKKVGYYSDSFMMGPRDIDFDSKDAEKEVERLVAEYYAEHPAERWFEDREPDLDEFLCKLYELTENEKDYKRYAKKGYPVLVIFEENFQEMLMACETTDGAMKEIERKGTVKKYKIYTAAADFEIR